MVLLHLVAEFVLESPARKVWTTKQPVPEKYEDMGFLLDLALIVRTFLKFSQVREKADVIACLVDRSRGQ